MKTHLHIPGKIYRVGGAVRDELLQYPSKETDYVVVGATPEEMLAAGFLPVGKSFPVFLHPKTKEEWVKLFKKTFRFTGGEIVNEFLMSIGILPGAHSADCPVYKKVLKAKPLWHIA